MSEVLNILSCRKCIRLHVSLNVSQDKCIMHTENIPNPIYGYLKLNSSISSCQEGTLMERRTSAEIAVG